MQVRTISIAISVLASVSCIATESSRSSLKQRADLCNQSGNGGGGNGENSGDAEEDPWVFHEVGNFWIDLESIQQEYEPGTETVVEERAIPSGAAYQKENAGRSCLAMTEIIFDRAAETSSLVSTGAFVIADFRSLSFNAAFPTGVPVRSRIHKASALGTVITQQQYACQIRVRRSESGAFLAFLQSPTHAPYFRQEFGRLFP